MGRSYSLDFLDTNTVSTTMGGIVSAATIRPRIYDFVIGSAATPGDQAASYHLERFTTAGTSTAVVAQALDPGDPATLLAATTGENHTVEPGYTTDAIMANWTVNQRATFRWVAREGKEIVLPATAAAGIGIITRVVTSAYTVRITVHEEE